jgi:hypothetical protein
VSFRKVTTLEDRNPIGWYGLARASDLDGDKDEAAEAWARYEAATPEADRLPRDGSQSCAIFLVDVGWGPYRSPNKLVGQFAGWKCLDCLYNSVTLAVPDKGRTLAYATDDLCQQAKTEGGMGGEVARKAVSMAGKEALRHVPVFGMFAPKSEADLRCWAVSPGFTHVGVLGLPAAPATVEVSYHGKDGAALPGMTQMVYFVGGRSFDNAPLIYVRSLPGPDRREISTGKKAKS